MGGHFMFDDDQETPNDLSCTFQFDLPDGKRKMLTFETRHWITNHEAEIGTPELGTAEPKRQPGTPALGPLSGRHDTIGNVFYGSRDTSRPAMRMPIPTRCGSVLTKTPSRRFMAERNSPTSPSSSTVW